MRFALLGNHPDGLSMTFALTATGRHSLVAYCGPVPGFDQLRQAGLTPKGTSDMEEVLADPSVEAVIVAGKPGERGQQLRRALQSERHVLCVHPADASPDTAYEAAMIQGDTRHVLLPLLGDALHPGVAELARMIRDPEQSLGVIHLLTVEHIATGEALLDADIVDAKPALPGWDVLRELAGEIVEISAFAENEEALPGKPLLVAGRTEAGTLIQTSFLARQPEARRRFSVVGSLGRAVLNLPGAWPGPVGLISQTAAGKDQHDWPEWSPWPVLVEVFEAAIGYRPSATGPEDSDNQKAVPSEAIMPRAARRKPRADSRQPTWQSELRCLELDDAARRSVERRRASALEYQEVSEEVGFKGTMTLLGCALLWSVLLLVILAAWDRRFLFVVIPLLAVFLGLQLLRWVIPGPPSNEKERETPTPR